MVDVARFVNWPLFIWFQCFVATQLLMVVRSRFMATSTVKDNCKFEIFVPKIFSLKQKLDQILPAIIEKIKFWLIKKTASCSFRL